MNRQTEPIVTSRDPFGRCDNVRQCVATKNTCDFCGQPPTQHKDGSARLFQYGEWSDSCRQPTWAHGLFCSIGCFRSYYG